MPAGASTILRARLAEIFGSTELGLVARELVPDAHLETFATRHGLDPRSVELLVLASYGDDGSITLARGPFLGRVVVAEIGHRMTPLESEADAPVYRRAGMYLRHRFELVEVGTHEIALVDGPPALTGLLLHGLHRQGSPSSPAVDETEASALSAGIPEQRLASVLEAEPGAPFLALHHGRPELAPEGIGLLLARLEDSALAIVPGEPGSLVLRARLFGEFPPGADENFRTLIASLSEADLGRALGLEEVARSLAIEEVASEIRLTATVRAATLARGLGIVLGAEIAEMLGVARR